MLFLLNNLGSSTSGWRWNHLGRGLDQRTNPIWSWWFDHLDEFVVEVVQLQNGHDDHNCGNGQMQEQIFCIVSHQPNIFLTEINNSGNMVIYRNERSRTYYSMGIWSCSSQNLLKFSN